jgi:hypothetical protein
MIPTEKQIEIIFTKQLYTLYKSVKVKRSDKNTRVGYIHDYDIELGKRTKYSGNDIITYDVTKQLKKLGYYVNTVGKGYIWLSHW